MHNDTLSYWTRRASTTYAHASNADSLKERKTKDRERKTNKKQEKSIGNDKIDMELSTAGAPGGLVAGKPRTD